MQFRKILLQVSLLLTVLFLFSPLTAQEIRENDKGEKIVVYPDGSWQYFSNFLSGTGERQGPVSPVADSLDNRYPVFEGKVAPMENPQYSITEEDARKIAIRQAQLAKNAALIAEKRAIEATEELSKLEEELQRVRQQLDENAPELQQLFARVGVARRTEQETTREALQAQGEVARAEELVQKGNYMEQLELSPPLRPDRPGSSTATERLNEDFFGSIANLDYRLLSPRPTYVPRTCQFAFEGVDEYTSQWRRDVQKQLLFTHTDERLRLYLKDKEYMRCEGFLSSLAGGYRFLTLQFTFAYPNAREAYGFIEKGSFLMVKLLNGDFITLRSGKMDRGRWDTEKELLTYSVHYPIDRSQINILRRSEMDSLLVFWSSGYEEYEVYEVGFFMNQLDCLEN